jgi:tetratricopeptide (TPR) repeat protein
MPDQSAPPTDVEPTPMYVLESPVPLSQSMVWRLQRTFYGDQGIAAWSRSHVPQSVTTSPIIARAYARVLLGFWRDIKSALDPAQPVYFVELGAGSGRFAYRFLKAFTALLEGSADTHQRVVYVMTDASPSVVEFWRDNPRLRPFVDAGVLDFAHFDLLELGPLVLLNSGTTLQVGEVANPIVLIANYIFDSIPQDAFTIKNGQLFPGLVSISASTPDLDLRAPQSNVKLSISFATDTVASAGDTEPDPLLQQILRGYLQRLGDTTVLIPRAAMACVRFFRELAGQRALCLVGDFGDTYEEDLRGHGPPGFGAGGGFWLPVNFHALGEYARGLGGRARHPRSRHISLNISMLLFGLHGEAFGETELAYEDAIDQRGPDELSVATRALAEHLPTLKLEAVLALLRTTGWDSDYVSRSVPFLIEALPTAEERLGLEMLRGVQLAWEQYYPIGEPDDLPFGLGVILYTLRRYPEALEFFERSLEQFGEDPRTTLNMALTLYRLQRLPETVEWLDRTLALDPANELANNMRPSVVAELAEAH